MYATNHVVASLSHLSMLHGLCEREGPVVAAGGDVLNQFAAVNTLSSCGSDVQHSGNLVIGFTNRIVKRVAQQLIITEALGKDKAAVASRHEQNDERELRPSGLQLARPPFI
ncbi:hypothetical protein ON010_g7867 [Phytophthora cinnamomi]|nr:hypothetical protein ON010_g7867 [Phytophthora cinnamomi]